MLSSSPVGTCAANTNDEDQSQLSIVRETDSLALDDEPVIEEEVKKLEESHDDEDDEN